MAGVSPHLSALLALEAYRTRLGAVLCFVDDAAAARIQVPTDPLELTATLDGLLEYFLGGEAAYAATAAELARHTSRVAEHDALCESLAVERQRTAALLHRLEACSARVDSRIGSLKEDAGALRAGAASSPSSFTDIVALAERSAYAARAPAPSWTSAQSSAPYLQPFPSDAQMRASRTFEMQAKQADASAASGAPGQSVHGYHSHNVGASVTAAIKGATSDGPPDVPEGGWLPIGSWFDRSALPDTAPSAAAAAAGGRGLDLQPFPSPPPADEAAPRHLVPAGPSSAAATAVAPSPSVGLLGGLPPRGAPATAPSAPASMLLTALAALPPAARSALLSHFPAGWRPGDPLPATLPDIASLLKPK